MDWNAVGAIGQWAGAIATFCAVLVSLKMARDANSIRVKIRAGRGVVTFGQGPVAVFTFSATNLGSRPVTLTSMGFILPSGIQLLPKMFSGQLPKKLEPLERLPLIAPVGEMAHLLAESNHQGRVKLRVFFDEESGSRHTCKWTLDSKMLC
jgi:hypothetical protein